MSSGFSLAICELFVPSIHGKTMRSSRDIDGQWLVYTCIPIEEFYDDSYREDIEALSLQHHHAVRSVRLDIIVMSELETGCELVGFIKTHLLKIIQRKWKKIYLARMRLIKERASTQSLRARQSTGKWPK